MTEGALVLEGGSLRGVFTAGVLDVFMEQGIEMSYVNGVSAGSMCGMSYVSKQIGRTIRVDLDYVNDRRFLSFRNMVKNRSIFNFDFLFGELSDTLVPFDKEAFDQSKQRFEVVATRCKTGKPEYFEKGVCNDFISAVKASSSLPILSRMIDVDGKKYLDGGASMPIAYQRAIDQGYEKVILVLTRNKGYRKKPVDKWTKRAYERYFAPIPRFLESLETAPERYNRMQEEIDRLEAEGRIYVIRPDRPVRVSRTEQDKKKLEALYEDGRRLAAEKLSDIREYLGIPNPDHAVSFTEKMMPDAPVMFTEKPMRDAGNSTEKPMRDEAGNSTEKPMRDEAGNYTEKPTPDEAGNSITGMK